MMRRWMFVALAMTVVCGVYVLAGARAQDAGRRAAGRNSSRPQTAQPASERPSPPRSVSPATATAAAPAFEGKLIAVSVRGEKQGKLLEQARFVEIKGRTFLVGKEAKATMSFPMGTDAHVAWDAVDAFYVFDSVEQYELALQKALQGVGDSMGMMLEGVFSGGQETGDSNIVPVPEPHDESSFRTLEKGNSAPLTEYITRDPDGRERRYIEHRARDHEGREVIVHEEEGQWPQPVSQPVPINGGDTPVRRTTRIVRDRDGRRRMVIEERDESLFSSANSPDVSKPVIRSAPPETTRDSSGQQPKPARSTPATVLPRSPSPR